jgi:ABC-type nickel/cobalt efflux system permease component RcnA
MVGVVAGRIPCPLTLFTMFLALGRAVPEADLTFVVAAMHGVGLTLGLVAVATVLARDWLVGILARHGALLGLIGRGLDGIAGTILILIGLSELLR